MALKKAVKGDTLNGSFQALRKPYTQRLFNVPWLWPWGTVSVFFCSPSVKSDERRRNMMVWKIDGVVKFSKGVSVSFEFDFKMSWRKRSLFAHVNAAIRSIPKHRNHRFLDTTIIRGISTSRHPRPKHLKNLLHLELTKDNIIAAAKYRRTTGCFRVDVLYCIFAASFFTSSLGVLTPTQKFLTWSNSSRGREHVTTFFERCWKRSWKSRRWLHHDIVGRTTLNKQDEVKREKEENRR